MTLVSDPSITAATDLRDLSIIEALPKSIALMETNEMMDSRIPSVEAWPIVTGSPVQKKKINASLPTTLHPFKQLEEHPLEEENDALSSRSLSSRTSQQGNDDDDDGLTVVHRLNPAIDTTTTPLMESPQLMENRPKHISVTIPVTSQSTIDFYRSSQQQLCIQAIAPTSDFAKTPLHAGDVVLSINGMPSEQIECQEDILQSLASSPSVTVVVDNPQGNPQLSWTHVVKPNRTTRLGLELVLSPNRRDIRISNVHEDGLLASSALATSSVGDQLLFINEINCASITLQEAAALLRNSTHLTLVTPHHPNPPTLLPPSLTTSDAASSLQDSSEPIPRFASATVPFVSKHLGLSLAVVEETRELLVTRVDPTGFFTDSCIQAGDRVLSINQVDCQECTSTTEVDYLLSLLQGDTITVVVEKPTGNPSVVASTVTKPAPDSMVGIVIRQRRRDGFRRTVVSRIVKDGLLSNSLLNIGDRLLAINGHDCSTSVSVHEAVDIIKRSQNTVTIVTQTQGDMGAVICSTGLLPDVMSILRGIL